VDLVGISGVTLVDSLVDVDLAYLRRLVSDRPTG
jgi:hypothetical protein